MTPRSRSALLLGGTLVLGMILGALVVGAVGQWRAGRIVDMRRPSGFVEELYRVIRPRDAEQRQAIRPIIEHVAQRNNEIMRDANEQLRDVLAELVEELAPLLDPVQRERLERFARAPRREPFGPRGGPGRPPPPGGRDPRRAPPR